MNEFIYGVKFDKGIVLAIEENQNNEFNLKFLVKKQLFEPYKDVYLIGSYSLAKALGEFLLIDDTKRGINFKEVCHEIIISFLTIQVLKDDEKCLLILDFKDMYYFSRNRHPFCNSKIVLHGNQKILNEFIECRESNLKLITKIIREGEEEEGALSPKCFGINEEQVIKLINNNIKYYYNGCNYYIYIITNYHIREIHVFLNNIKNYQSQLN